MILVPPVPPVPSVKSIRADDDLMLEDLSDSNVVLVGEDDHMTLMQSGDGQLIWRAKDDEQVGTCGSTTRTGKLNESFDEFKNRQLMKAGDVEMSEVLKVRASDGHAYTLTEIADAAMAGIRSVDENWRTVVNIPHIRSDSPLIRAWGGQDGEPYRVGIDKNSFEQVVVHIAKRVAAAECWTLLDEADALDIQSRWHKLFDMFLPYIVDKMLRNPEMVAELAAAIRLRWSIMPTGAAQGGGLDDNPYEGMI